MSTTRRDDSFGPRNLLVVLGGIIAGMLTVPFVVPFWKSHSGWVGVLVLLAPPICVGVVGLVLGYRTHRRYRCRECGEIATLLTSPTGMPLSYRYHCPRCDIIWETGVTEGEA